MVLAYPADPGASWPDLPETDRRVLRELLLHGEQSRVRIAERLGLSRTSLTRIARGLLDAGFVAEGEVQSLGTRGRPAEGLQPQQDVAHFAGVKLTGEDLYLVVTDLGATIVAEASVPLPSHDVGDVVALIADEIDRMADPARTIVGVGVAVAGDVVAAQADPILHRSHFLGWDGVPLARLVTDRTGLPTTIVNDVHALAGAQHWFAGEPGGRSIAVFGVGAGIGCGVMIGDEVHQGAHGRAGRVGHTRIGGRGRRCDNGHRDCLHSFVTIPAIEHNARAGAGGYAEAVARARAGEPVALGALTAAARALGAAVAETVNAFDPDVVAVMGEGIDMLDLAPEAFDQALAEFLEQGEPASVRVERPPFHFDLYARGAAVAVMRELLG